MTRKLGTGSNFLRKTIKKADVQSVQIKQFVLENIVNDFVCRLLMTKAMIAPQEWKEK